MNACLVLGAWVRSLPWLVRAYGHDFTLPAGGDPAGWGDPLLTAAEGVACGPQAPQPAEDRSPALHDRVVHVCLRPHPALELCAARLGHVLLRRYWAELQGAAPCPQPSPKGASLFRESLKAPWYSLLTPRPLQESRSSSGWGWYC